MRSLADIDFHHGKSYYEGRKDPSGMRTTFNLGLVKDDIRTSTGDKLEMKEWSKEV